MSATAYFGAELRTNTFDTRPGQVGRHLCGAVRRKQSQERLTSSRSFLPSKKSCGETIRKLLLCHEKGPRKWQPKVPLTWQLRAGPSKGKNDLPNTQCAMFVGGRVNPPHPDFPTFHHHRVSSEAHLQGPPPGGQTVLYQELGQVGRWQYLACEWFHP